MMTKRLRKKRAKAEAQRQQLEPQKKGELTEAVVTVPCPECNHPTMRRRFLPAAGPMNGSASCPRCAFEDDYLAVLSRAMLEDPIPETIMPAPRRITIGLAPSDSVLARTARWMTSTQRVFANLLGIRRRWRFAST
jgi:hypothetical protein